MLLPAGVGSNWFKAHVHRQIGVYIHFLNGRLTFVGQPTCYPKDCMLIEFGAPFGGYGVWSWRENAA